MAKRLKLSNGPLDSTPVAGGAYFDNYERPPLFTSGCCVLDCCIGGGWCERLLNIVGDKSTGKTLLACEAAANYLAKYPDARVWYRDTEAAFDEPYMTHLGIPASRFDYSDRCFAVEDVFDELDRLIKVGERGLYIVDSLDALSDRAEEKRGIDEGTYGLSKAKQMSQLFRRLNQRLAGSITVLVVSQVRDKIGVAFGEHYTRSGGRALDFYASQVVWLSQVDMHKRTIKEVVRPIGIQVRAKCKKNKVGPPFREVEFPLIFDYGVEDLVAGAEWLNSVKADKLLEEAVGKRFDSRGVEVGKVVKRLTSLPMVARLDSTDYKELRSIVAACVQERWAAIEREFVPRRRKYGDV
jgi:protein RecA